jgi:hypothetical protein
MEHRSTIYYNGLSCDEITIIRGRKDNGSRKILREPIPFKTTPLAVTLRYSSGNIGGFPEQIY